MHREGVPAPGLRLAILGPLRAWHGDVPVRLGSVQQRVVLAILAVRAGRPIGRDQLVQAVWGEQAPAYGVNLVQKHVSALRRALEPVRSPGRRSGVLPYDDAGYRLTLPPDALDLTAFDGLVARAGAARARGDLPRAAEALHAARRLWRGAPLEGLSNPLLDEERDRLAERAAAVVEDCAEADLALGRGPERIADLRALVAEHPLRERPRALLMRALAAAGRQADALAVYQETRRRFVDELGVEPAAELQHLHRRLLRGDADVAGGPEPAAGPGTGTGADPAAPPRTPAQLPHGMTGYTGRATQLAALDGLLDREHATPIALITGTAGVGKTSLAVHWAHRVSHRFPDGQLYVDLRGFGAHAAPLEPADALRGFFEALAVPHARVPARLADQAALFRSLLAGRRILVVLDNAHDSEQVEPLLPGAPGCAVVVTCRRRLAGLVAAGAVPLTLDLLSPPEAREFLARRIGADRVAAEPAAVDAIVAACARLPLALAIVAARAAVYPELGLAVLAEELGENGGTLDAFVGERPADDARTVLSWSYQRLSPAAAQLFRLLGLHAGPDLPVPAAASLAGLTVAAARRLLTELTGATLLQETTPGRFALHDLLRVYARERVLATESDAERHAATRRLLDHYLHTAAQADRTLYPYRQPAALVPAAPGVVTSAPEGTAAALVWFLGEAANLLVAVEQAYAEGLPRHACQLAWTCTAFLNYQGRWHEWTAVLGVALAASRATGDTAGQAMTHRLLSLAALQRGRLAEAEAQTRLALDLLGELGDRPGQARLHLDYGRLLERQGHGRAALERAELALDLFRDAGDRAGEADALSWVGSFRSRLGFHEEALHYCHRSLDLHRELGDSPRQADTWDALAAAHHHLGHHDEAMACHEQALAMWRELGDRYEVATTMLHLGDTQRAAGDHDAARALWTQARAILDELGHPLGQTLGDRLGDVPPTLTDEGNHHV